MEKPPKRPSLTFGLLSMDDLAPFCVLLAVCAFWVVTYVLAPIAVLAFLLSMFYG